MIQTFRFVSAGVAPAPGASPDAGPGTPIGATPGVLGLSPAALASIGRPLQGRVTVAHGARRTAVTVLPLAEAGSALPVAAGTLAELGLVEGIPYRVVWRGGELCIGPVIGILAARRSAEIDLEPGGFARQFLLRYPETGGLVYLFGAEDVDLESETIDGYCWVPNPDRDPAAVPDLDPEDPGLSLADPDLDPDFALGADWLRARRLAARVRAAAEADGDPATPHPRILRFRQMAEDFLDHAPLPEAGPGTGHGAAPGGWSPAARLGSGRFQAGRFPFPGALWRRAGFLTQPVHDHLTARLGPRIFNADFFNKQEGYRLLSARPEIRPHLPATEILTGGAPLFRRLQQEGRAVLKQVEGNSGYGLMRLERAGDGFMLRFRDRAAAELFPGRPEVEARLLPILSAGRYLLQHWVDLPEYKGRLCDFRLMMQKDGAGLWSPVLSIGRFGGRGSIVTNFVNDGYALPADEALGRAFGLGHADRHRLSAELSAFGVRVCQAIDLGGGCYGDLGLDIGIDRARRLWLFEANKLPFLELPLYMGDEQGYLRIKSGPLLFAAYLAGFPTMDSSPNI